MSEVIQKPTVALFEGQGDHRPGMGKAAFDLSDSAKEVFNSASESTGINMSRVCFGDLVYLQKIPEIAQAAVATVDLAELRAWENVNEQEIKAITGLSMGLTPAVSVAGSIEASSTTESDGIAVYLTMERAKILEELSQTNPGGMIAVLDKLRSEIVSLLPENIKVAVTRHEKYHLLSGPRADLVTFLEKHGVSLGGERKARKAAISIAAHHPMQTEAQPAVRDLYSKFITKDAERMFAGNSPEACFLTTPQQIIDHLVDQLIEEALWADMLKMLSFRGIKSAIQFGPDHKRRLLKDVTQNTSMQPIYFLNGKSNDNPLQTD